MSRLTPEQRSQRARLAVLSRPDRNPEARADAQREYRASRLEDHIREQIHQKPPLTDEQRARLAALFVPSGGDAA